MVGARSQAVHQTVWLILGGIVPMMTYVRHMQVKYTFNKYTASSAPHTNVELNLGDDKQQLRPEVQRRLDELTDLLTTNKPTKTSGDVPAKRKFDVGAIIRMPWAGPTPESSRGFRVWRIEGDCLGGLGQESVYGLVSLDRDAPNDQDGKVATMMYVPVLLLETHPDVEVVG